MRTAVVPEVFASEKDFQAQLVSAAKRMGWDPIYHTHDSRHGPHPVG